MAIVQVGMDKADGDALISPSRYFLSQRFDFNAIQRTQHLPRRADSFVEHQSILPCNQGILQHCLRNIHIRKCCAKSTPHSLSEILFFGNTNIPVIPLDDNEQQKFKTLHEVFIDELETKDNIQAEMLRMLMARFIIKSTRLLKAKQGVVETPKSNKVDLLRSFNFLVEQHFKTEHSVSFYADKLFKSPKTLSNNFAKLNRSPLQIIHQRIVLEAKRLLTYTDKTAKEIAYEVGFEDASHLSRLFKKYTSQSPSEFKKGLKSFS